MRTTKHTVIGCSAYLGYHQDSCYGRFGLRSRRAVLTLDAIISSSRRVRLLCHTKGQIYGLNAKMQGWTRLIHVAFVSCSLHNFSSIWILHLTLDASAHFRARCLGHPGTLFPQTLALRGIQDWIERLVGSEPGRFSATRTCLGLVHGWTPNPASPVT